MYGYNIFIGKNREKMEIINKLPESQQKVHLVVNSLETYIPSNVADSVSTHFSKKYIKSAIELDNSYFHVWEILSDNDLLKESKKICVAAISSNPTKVLSCVSLYRNNTKDVYCAIDFDPKVKEEVECTSGKIEKVNFEKGKDVKNIKKEFFEKTKENFTKKQSATLVLADGQGDMITSTENGSIYLTEVVLGLNILEKNGTFILHLSEAFKVVTVKLITILSSLFEKVTLHKPATSKDYISEFYVVCIKYKENKDLIKTLTTLLEKAVKESDYIVDIFPELEIPSSVKDTIVEANNNFVEIEYQCINKIYEFILEKNFYGVKYHNYLETQLGNSREWIKSYIK